MLPIRHPVAAMKESFVKEFRHSAELVLPFALLSKLLENPPRERCHFYGKNNSGDRVMVIGERYLDDALKVNIFSPKDFLSCDTVICHVKDIECLSGKSQDALMSKREQAKDSLSPRRRTKVRNKTSWSEPVSKRTRKSKSQVGKPKEQLSSWNPSMLDIPDSSEGTRKDIKEEENRLSDTVDCSKSDDDISWKDLPDNDDTNVDVRCGVEKINDGGSNPEDMSLQKNVYTKSENQSHINSNSDHSDSPGKEFVVNKMKSAADISCETSMDKVKVSDYYLGLQARHLLSEKAQKKLIEKSFKCLICRYSAVLKTTFKCHLLSRHKLTADQYKERFSLLDITTNDKHQRESDVSGNKYNIADDTPQTCAFCDSILSSKKSLREHLVMEHHTRPEELLEDNTVESKEVLPDPKTFAPPRKRKAKGQQKKKVELQTKIVCNLCDAECSNKRTLSSHLRQQHKSDPKAKTLLHEMLEDRWKRKKSKFSCECPFCHEKYPGNSILMHMRVFHIEEDSFDEEFKIVEKAFARQKYYSVNREKRLSVVSCPHCKSEMKQSTLSRHVKNHCKMNPDVKKRYDCHMCSYFSYDKQQIQDHKNSAHSERKKFICHTCAATFNTACGLRQHMRIKHNHVNLKPLPEKRCPECDKIFNSKSNLQRHMSMHKAKVRNFPCEICDMKFATQTHLEYHTRTSHHDGVNSHSCDTTNSQQNLEDHECKVRVEVMEKLDSHQGPLYSLGTDADLLTFSDNATQEQTLQLQSSSQIKSGAELSDLMPSQPYNQELMVAMDTSISQEGDQQRTLNVATLPDGSTVILMPSGAGLDDTGLQQDDIFTIYQTGSDVGYNLNDNTL